MIDNLQIDRNLQVLSGVENSWGLPALPDTVKLDLASMDGVDHNTIGQFATGLSSDLQQATAPKPQPLQLVDSTDTQPSYSVKQQFDRAWAGLVSAPAPTEVDDNGVAAFKDRAKQLGFLDKSVPSDSTWNPALNQTRWQVMQHDSNQRFAGNEFGSVSQGGLSKFIGDWLSPTGLLKAATKLQILPDFGKTIHDATNILHTLGDFVTHPSFDTYKNLFITNNPYNDLMLPVANDFLMLSGVGEVWSFARAATLGADAAISGAELANAADGLLGSTKLPVVGTFLKSADYAADAERFKEASKLSELVGKAGPIGQSIADKMQAWRDLEAVAITKKGVQAGMRLGLAQKVEDAAGLNGGVAFNQIPGGRTISDYVNTVVTNPLVSTIGEALFTPPNILEPGTFTNAAKALNPLRFAKVPQDQQLSLTFYNAVRDHLATSDPAALDALNQNAKDIGPGKALAEHFFGGSTDQHLDDLGKAMTYVTTAAAMDSFAAAKADQIASRVLNPDRWQQIWATYRNKYIAQLRQWDGLNDDQLLAHKAQMLAASDGEAVGNASVIYKRLVSQAAEDPSVIANLRGEVANHDQWARGFYAELLNEGAKPAVIQKYLPQTLDTLGNWSEYANAQANVFDAVNSGLLDDAKFSTATSERGRRLVLTPAENAAAKASPTAIPYNYQLFNDEGYMPWLNSNMYKPLARGVDPSTGAFTVARTGAGIDTVTKQEMIQFAQSIQGRMDLLRDVRRASARGLNPVFDQLGQAAADAGAEGIHQLDNGTASDLLNNIELANQGKNRERIDGILSWMRHAGYGSLDDMRAGLEDDLRQLDGNPAWQERFGIPNIVQGPDGVAPASLETKRKALIAKSKWTAAEVDVPDGLNIPDGYKLVHGVQYLLPSDLLWTNPMADLTESHVRRATLGAWFTKQDNKAFGAQLSNTQRFNLSQRLSALDPSALDGIDPALKSPDLDTVLGSLHNIVNTEQDRVQGILDSNGVSAWKKGILSGTTPVSVDDLGRAYNRNLVIKGLTGYGYSQEVAEAAWQALKDAQAGSFKRYGLATIDRSLKANPVLLQALYALGGSKAGDGMLANVGGAVAKALPVAAGGVAGYEAGKAIGGDGGGVAGALAGGVAGLAGAPLVQQGFTKAGDFVHNNWLQYAYIGDQYEHLRDTFRFGINPFFDVRRFVKSTVLAHTADLPADINLSAIPTKTSFIKEFGQDTYDKYASEMASAFRGNFDPNLVEDTHQYFTQRGLLGYDPTSWMTHMYGRLRMAGVDMDQAADTVRNVYAYGTQGRSAAEQSLNYILFPFSFEKKVALQLGRYVTKDLSRAVMIHDGMKTYDLLDQNFDLHDKLAAYVPLAQELQKLNPLDHGLSAGELGGINAPLLKLFLPQVFRLTDAQQAKGMQNFADRLLPFWGEVQHMKDSLYDQGHVLASPSHMATAAETDAGFQAARDLRNQFQQALDARHVTWNEFQRNPDLAPLKGVYDAELAKVMSKYPAYEKERANIPALQAKLQDELLVRTNDPMYMHRPENMALAQFKGLVDQLDNGLRNLGYSPTENPDQMPPNAFDAVHGDAAKLARAVPGFVDLYNRFYAKTWGPITKELT